MLRLLELPEMDNLKKKNLTCFCFCIICNWGLYDLDKMTQLYGLTLYVVIHILVRGQSIKLGQCLTWAFWLYYDVTEQIVGQQSHQPSRTSWPRYHQSLIREAGILLMQEGKYLLGNAPKILSCSEPTFYPQLHSPIMWESWTLKGFHRISLVQFSCMRNKNKAWRLIF